MDMVLVLAKNRMFCVLCLVNLIRQSGLFRMQILRGMTSSYGCNKVSCEEKLHMTNEIVKLSKYCIWCQFVTV